VTAATNRPDRPLTDVEAGLIDAWWRAANYISVGQIYLLDNPLLSEPLKPEHVKPRLLGHWGTTPGLNFIYAHMNRHVQVPLADHEVAVGEHSTWWQVATRAQGSRLAWCSTTVVTTTSAGPRRRR
jgi:phosphoketolase